ncbi:MAG: hypothetical protein DWQ02_21500 [Bacteroidetes bacterium]|nr:MAG: hypothetical protein DWQ02_21500 [Bacteroidota bacterium]
MRKWINKGFKYYATFLHRREMQNLRNPVQTQNQVLRQLIQGARDTDWGKRHGYRSIRTPEAFAAQVPIQDYDSLKPFIQRMMHGERDVLWNGQVQWFSKSSGTTNDKSKFIPVSRTNLNKCHIKGSWHTMMWFYQNRSDARQFEMKTLLMGGSLDRFEPHPRTLIGDVSAIMIHNMPTIGKMFFTPDLKTAILPDWEEKLEKMAQICAREERMVSIGGVPTWTILFLRRILEITGKDHMLEVWPNFQAYIHGGVSFDPYRKQFEKFFPSDKISYQEIYNASEGYFAVQNDFDDPGLLLLLNNGIYYEFIPIEEWGKTNQKAVTLKDVEIGKDYALVISTNAGLWRYQVGDTITFTSLNPPKIRVTGRTKQFVNAFGEEVMVANTDKALAMTCRVMDAIVSEYTVAPVYLDGTEKGSHEWLVEFEKAPKDIEKFSNLLDINLQKVNSDYEAKRYKDMALECLRMTVLPKGTFLNWMRARGKVGGQNKVPRLANDRKYVDQILEFFQEE